MPFLIVRKADHDSEAGGPPSRASIDAIADHLDTLAAQGRFHAGEGLKPSRDGVRVSFTADGQAVVVNGPFADTADMIAGFSIIEAASIEDAVAWAEGWPVEDANGNAELEIRPIGCPGGLSGFGNPTEGESERPRYMVMLKANPRSETDWNPGPDILGRMAEANRSGTENGTLLAGHGLSSSRHAKRVRFASGRPAVFDGPFAEIKEMVAGFWILRVDTLTDAIAWAETYPFPDGTDARLEIRPLYGIEELLATAT